MMMSSQTQFRHLKMQVQRKLAETLQLTENHFQRKFPIPIISYDLRGVKAGVAYLQKNEIKFNRTLLYFLYKRKATLWWPFILIYFNSTKVKLH